jgi:DNA repair exonuclease SbcCD ATPase subunit
MKLISITIRNYRIHAERRIDFDPSRTVIGGPNEAGKSTVIEAVHRALFLRSRATGAVLDSMRSHFHPGHPSVELTFESGGSTYTLTKQFTGTTTAPTMLAEAGGATLRNEQAEEKLRELLDADDIRGRNVEERLRVQWAHLWVWQGVAGSDPLAGEGMKEPLDRLQKRLGSLGAGDVLESRTDAAVGSAVAETHASRTKDNGSPKVGSPLGRAETELAESRARVAAAKAAIDSLDGAIADVERADATIAASDASLATRRQEQEDNERRLRQAQSLEVLQAEQLAAANVAAARLAALRDGDRQIRECDALITGIDTRRMPATARHATAVAAERDAADRSATALAAARACQREQADVAELAELHARAEHLERRRHERVGLAGRCRRIATLRTEADDLQARIDALPAVTPADLADLTDLERKCDAAQAKLDAIATRIELLAAAAGARLGDHDLAVGQPETITTDTDLDVGGARLRISPGGGTSLTEATHVRDDAAVALEARLRAVGVPDVDEARRVQPLRQTLESALDAKRTAIEDLGGAKADRELADLDAEIATLELAFAGVSRGDFARPEGLDAAIAARAAIADRLHDLVQSLSTATAAQQAAEQRQAEARRERELAEDVVRTIDDEFRTADARRRVLVEEHGAEREEAIATAAATHTAAAEALAATRSALGGLQPELLRQTAGRLQRAIERILATKQEAQATRTIAIDRLRTEGTLDPRADLANAHALERIAEATHRQAAREARAHELLAGLFAEKKREIEARFVGPLTERVHGYLGCLFGPDAAINVEYVDGKFKAIEVARPEFGGVAFPFARLSGGGQEQVAAAFRLAMAEILAEEHGGCLPIVFDDAFVNSDPARVAAVQGMLDLAAERGLQVVILSCNHRDYDSLGALTVELPRATFAGVSPAARPAPAAAEDVGGMAP